MIGRMIRALRRWSGREEGNVTVEFVLIFPAFLIIFLSAFESGLLMTRHVMLERSLDIAVRDLRLGNFVNLTHASLKERICENSVIIPDCENVLLLEMRPVNTTTWQPLGTNATCVDRAEEIQPVLSFDPGIDNEMMLVRACVVFDPLFPGTGLGAQLPLDETGGYALISNSAFVNEPG